MKFSVKEILKIFLLNIVGAYFIRTFNETGWPFTRTDLFWGLGLTVIAIVVPRIKAYQKGKYQAKWGKPTNRK